MNKQEIIRMIKQYKCVLGLLYYYDDKDKSLNNLSKDKLIDMLIDHDNLFNYEKQKALIRIQQLTNFIKPKYYIN